MELVLDEAPMAEMMNSAQDASDMLKALAHEQRLLILCMLSDGEKSVRELEILLKARQPSVSQQLARLRSDRLVTARRDGKTIYYSVADEKALRLVKVVYDIYCSPVRD
ncbi:ArsR/SmtB family transcription factor [Rhodovibrionaceae bacterium A322]